MKKFMRNSWRQRKAMLSAVIIVICTTQVNAAIDACTITTPLTSGTTQSSSNLSGKTGNYTWTIWSSGTGGTITPRGVNAAFKATWTNSGDFLARVGLQWDETKTYDQYGTVEADYSYTRTGTAGNYSFIGIYGWSNTPLVEYYIVDDWWGTSPPTGGGTLMGTLNVDGGTYKIYTHTQVNQPSIHDTQTFPQFFSVRQTARQCGHISLSEHWKKWASLGMTMGKMYEAKLLVEAGGGVGSIDYTYATLVANASSTATSSSAKVSSSNSISSSSAPAVSQTAYSSTTIPGTLQAENYDVGGESVSFHDADVANSGSVYRTDGVDITGDAASGYKIGWTTAGEWLEYTVNVATAGIYNWEANVSATADGKKFHVLLDSTTNITGAVTVPNTGSYDTYGSVKGTTPSLSIGKHVLRIVMDSSYFNIDWISFTNSAVKLQPSTMLGIGFVVSEFQVYNVLGTHIGSVKAINGKSLLVEVSKLAPQAGRYIVRSSKGSDDFIINITK